ncbi:MAG: energy-coupling factor ABC transporter ATP-binding protein [Nitrososphaeria archaeon]|nr:energy-coupling factor ABC transporter ATP-binding protein [Nitrososphaeria archaeon]
MNALKVQELGCKYNGHKPVLSGASFFLKEGEAVGVIGSSGSGKTTLAYCLMGIIPNRIEAEVWGKVYFNNENVLGKNVRDIVRFMNLIMQNYESQIFGLTVEEDIRFGLENLGLDENEISLRVNWALKNFGLEYYRNFQPSKLSGGLKQRLAIASTTVMGSNFLIMDDPTSNLDWNGIICLRHTISYLKSIGKGVLILSRKLKGLEECLDRIYYLDGQMFQLSNNHGPTHETCVKNFVKNNDNVNVKENGSSIKIEDLWFKYEKNYVLKNVNLEIPCNSIVSVMGPNGSGKTTLVKHFNGLLKPSKGNVFVDGKNTRNYSPAQLAKYVGFVFQDPDRHIVSETVWDEVTFACKNLGLPLDNAKNALKLLNLDDLRDRPPYLLSMGEKVRLMIASALAADPKILVLDEPTTGQDSRTLGLIKDAIFRMRCDGKSVIIVTHDTDFALKVSDSVIIVKDGSIVEFSPVKNVLLNDKKIELYELEPPTLIEERVN